MNVFDKQIKSAPEFKNTRLEIENFTRTYRRITRGSRLNTIHIPVVVHVVYKNSSENISKNQIMRQIDVLNADFSKSNDNMKYAEDYKPLAVDTRILFGLAKQDPDGKATDGITRTRTDVAAFSHDDKVKSKSSGGQDPWPMYSYLNVWVCRLSGGLLGYAQFPGMDPRTDGVVITYQAFGLGGSATKPFHLGRTVVHEVGHWLNLLHIWGDDNGACSRSDNVEDTPNQADSNAGVPKYPHITCNNRPHGDMYMNYMDYSDDECMCMFTRGQAERMHATLRGPRSSIVNSNGLNPQQRQQLLSKRLGIWTKVRDNAKEKFNGFTWQ